MQQDLKLQVYIEGENVEIQAARDNTFKQILETLIESESTNILKDVNLEDVKIISKDVVPPQELTINDNLGELKQAEQGLCRIEVTWSKNKHKILLEYQGTVYNKELGEEVTIDTAILMFKNEKQLASNLEIFARVNKDPQKVIQGSEKIKILIKRYGADLKLNFEKKQITQSQAKSKTTASLPPCVDQSTIKMSGFQYGEEPEASQQIEKPPSQGDIGGSRPNMQKIKNEMVANQVVQSKVTQPKEVQVKIIKIIIEMVDMEKNYMKTFEVDPTTTFDQMRPQIDEYCKNRFDYWNPDGEEEIVIIDIENNNNKFVKVDQPFKRIFGKSCTSRTFKIIRKYPGGG